jgi:uncharacterized protein with GYD domain
METSHAIMGRSDVVDIVEAEDPIQVEKAAMLIRAVGSCNAETLAAAPWKEFRGAL